MADPISQYLESRRAFDQAVQPFQRIRNIVVKLASDLKNVSDNILTTDVEIGSPPKLEFSEVEVSIDAEQWPTADQIQQTIRDRSSAHRAMVQAWNDIPRENRAGLKRPDQL